MRHIGEKALDYRFSVITNDRINGTYHTHIGNKCSTMWENPGIDGPDVGMSTHDSTYPPIEIAPHRSFFRSSLSMEIHNHRRRSIRKFTQCPIHSSERAIQIAHESAPQQVNHHHLPHYETAATGRAGGIVEGTKDR